MKSTGVEDDISAFGRVTSNVSEGPDTERQPEFDNGKVHLRLLTDIEDVRGEESDKVGNGTGANDDLGVVRCTGCDVCQSADTLMPTRKDALVRAQAASN